MEIEIHHQPANAAAKISLNPNESCTAEAGLMIAMSDNISITTTTHKKSSGSLLKGLKRMLAGESLFLNHFTAGGDNGDVWVAPVLSGDMFEYDLKNETLIAESGSFMACEDSVDIDLGWQGFKSLLSGEGLFWLKLNGTGKVILNSFGAIYPVDVDGEYIVDTGHIVAFNESLEFSITKAGKSWISSFLGGEALVCKFKGQGRVWCQSHNRSSFGKTLGPMLKPRKS